MSDKHHLEKTFEHRERKEIRRQRKMQSAKDRSKYKKTDQRQLAKQREELPIATTAEQGKVIAIRSEGMIVSAKGRTLCCFLRGVLKKERNRVKNLVAIGDEVLFRETSSGEGIIERVLDRKSTLSRAETLSQKQQQIIAANIDQVLITMSVVIPPIKPSLIDRYIIATRRGNMNPVLVINKIDLLDDRPADDPDRILFHQCLEAYEKAGIPVVAVSSETQRGLDNLKEIMKNCSSVFTGQSGVGKSSLINAVTGLDLAVGETTQRTRKGTHTTTSAELISLDCGGWCIDTPGIRSFGIWDINKEELKDYYPEFHLHVDSCRFPNCSHTHEPECGVVNAVKECLIHPLRYNNYYDLYNSLDKEHIPR